MFSLKKIFGNQKLQRQLFRRDYEAHHFSASPLSMPDYLSLLQNGVSAFKQNYPFKFWISEDERRSVVLRIKKVVDESIIREAADRIIRNQYVTIGGKEFVSEPDALWKTDPVTGRSLPTELAWRFDYTSLKEPVELSALSEISSLKMLNDLALAYFVTNDEEYALKYKVILLSFVSNNPCCVGIHWAVPGESALREILLLFTLPLMFASPHLDLDFFKVVLQYLMKAALYYESELTISDHPRMHHMITMAAAVIGITGVFHTLTPCQRMSANAKAAIEQHISTVVLQDGTSSSESPCIGLLVTEVCLVAKIFLERIGSQFSQEFQKLAASSVRAIHLLTDSQYHLPRIGDVLPDNLFAFSVLNRGQRNESILRFGSVLYPVFESASQSTPSDIVRWLILGDQATLPVVESDKPTPKIIEMPHGGYYGISDGSVQLIIKASSIANPGSKIPGHEDIFSFEYTVDGIPLFTDAGSYSHYLDSDVARRMRSVVKHNTSYIDNLPLSERNPEHITKADTTKPKLLDWQCNDEHLRFSAQHYSYVRLADPVICKRSILWQRQNSSLRLKDEFFGGDFHQIVTNFHLHPDVTAIEHTPTEWYLAAGDLKFRMTFEVSADLYKVSLQDSLYAPAYGVLQQSKRINLICKDRLPAFYRIEVIRL